jgi:signal transduction histidine kinase
VVAALVLLCGSALTWLEAATPGDGVLLRGGIPGSPGARVRVVPGVRVRVVAELYPTGLRFQDEVRAVNGRDIQAWTADLAHRPAAIRPWRPGQTVVYQVRRDGAVGEVGVPVRRPPLRSPATWPLAVGTGNVVIVLLFGYVFLRRPSVPAARAGVVLAAGFALGHNADLYTLQVHPVLGPLARFAPLLGIAGIVLWRPAMLHFALVFPSPRLLAGRRWLLGLVYGLPLGLLATYVALSTPAGPTAAAQVVVFTGTAVLLFFAYPLASILALVWAYRTSTDVLDRQLMRLVGGTAMVVLLLEVSLFYVPWLLSRPPLVPASLHVLLALPVIAAVAVAILRYQAFDLDVLANRTLVWGGLTAWVAAVYGGTLLLLGLLLEHQARPRFVLTLLATGLVALGLQPLHQRLQRAVNRWMYGDRDDPAAVLARLGSQIQAAGPPGSVLDGIVATVGQAMRLAWVAIELDRPTGPELAASWGQPGGTAVALPLAHEGQPVGRLLVTADPQSGALRPRDRRLLGVLAQQASAAVHAVRLAAELEDSRAQLEHAHGRLLHAREEERRRLRRDLHDGLGPLLAGMTLQVDAARNLLNREPTGTDKLLGTIRDELELAVGDVRRLVDALQPTPLDQLGLVPALREAAARFSTATLGPAGDGGLLVEVQAPGELPELPAAVELAAYRIATEALTNTARHAGARHCWIRVAGNGALEVEVTDDGHGHPPDARSIAGVGLASMAERAAELGGACTVEFTPGVGTRVHAYLPLPQG